MRLVEIRLLEGPNVYALQPTVKVEVALGRARRWSGERIPGRDGSVRIGTAVPARDRPDEVAALVAWLRRLRLESGEGLGGVTVHRSSDPGHWIVACPWTGAERARAIAEAAFALVERGVSSARRARLTGAQARLLERRRAAIAGERTTPPPWIRDGLRRMPVVSVTGTNGKSTVTRLATHVLALAGRHVGTTTSDGIYVDEGLVDPGDWTGPGGAARVLGRDDVDVAVLETARGGILLRGVGYESNDVSVLTNVSSDHLDLQGIHTLPELAEVKATICRITRPEGRVVLNADDRFVLGVARRVKAPVALFSLAPTASPRFRSHLRDGGIGYTIRDGSIIELEGAAVRAIAALNEVPIAIGGIAAYNVANALAAAAAVRGLGVTIEEVACGLRDFRPTAAMSPGRLNLFRLGESLVVVDFAHNEAGVRAVLDLAKVLADSGTRDTGTGRTGTGRTGTGRTGAETGRDDGGSGRKAAVTAIVGTAGDRPDDTLRAIGRVAAERATRVAIKETLGYLRGRSREHVVAQLLAGVAAGGKDPRAVPIYESEPIALRGELAAPSPGPDGDPGPRILVLLCHEDREAVFGILDELGALPVDATPELATLARPPQQRSRADPS